ncbi:hypothetical protein Clacol_004317 [Clathrus columnatus]|uniref:Aminoglycoside phosphotransferase domain-containing protein n=1 Tax=Clathrus columnatus TaxID=1419009 RepID=A0AAV5AAP7_9AGAM|nr:hypothetical protein Clacol_004317 [Clathrus columnatus]
MVESSSDSRVPDLTTTDGVKAYLFHTPYRAVNVTSLTGGFTNFTYRVTLQKPFFDSSTSPGALISTVVLKHAKPYIASVRTYSASAERQDYEALAYREVPTIVSPFTNVSLPKIYFQDQDNYVIIMYDCGESCITLKDYLKFHSVPLEAARRIGNSLGRFIGELHVASHKSRPADSPGVLIKHKFEEVPQKFDVFGFFHGIITRDLPRTTERYDEIIALLGNMHDKIKYSKEVLVMGDFSTGNMLIDGNSLEHLSIIDWETARSSLAGLDVSRLLAEVYTIAKFHPSSRCAVNELISTFIASYKSVVTSETNARNFNEIVKVVAFNVGVHLIVITPMEKPEWGSDEEVGEIVAEGISFLLNAEDDMWLRESFLGGLYV